MLNKTTIIKISIIAVPTYAVAILTEAMVYTIPMLAITTIVASEITSAAQLIRRRVDDGDPNDDGQTSSAEQQIDTTSNSETVDAE